MHLWHNYNKQFIVTQSYHLILLRFMHLNEILFTTRLTHYNTNCYPNIDLFPTFHQFILQSFVTGLNPGWPELAGIDHLTAIDTIKHEMLGVTIIYGTKVFSRIVDHHKRDIVWLDMNVDGHLSGIPTLGA